MKNLLAGLLLVSAFSVVAADLVPFNQAQREALGIETTPVVAIEARLGPRLPGKVAVPNGQLQIVTAPQPGLVGTLLVSEGEAVKKGQPMLRLQSPRMLELQGEYLEIRARHDLARSNYKRDRQLNSEGIIAKRRFLESEAKYRELDTSLARTRSILELAGMNAADFKKLESDRELSSTLTVTAPFDGVVLEQMVTAGKRVEAADPLYRVASLQPLWLEIHVPLEQLGDTRPGQTVVVPEAGLSGNIITVGGMVHGADQGVLVRAEILEGTEKLRPGQFLQVQLSLPTGPQSYRVPKSAVVYAQGKSWVFVEQPGGFEAVSVTVASEETAHLVLQAGLAPDARIATRGSAAIKAAWLGGAE